MAKAKNILVIGLGRFGSAVVDSLLEMEQNVSVVDIDEKSVERYASKVDFAKVCDTREEEVLEQLSVNNFDYIVVAIGYSIESSIITTLLLKGMGVKEIIVKAKNKQHKAALSKLGITKDYIIMPEFESGEKLALLLSYPVISEHINLLGGKYGLIELYPRNTFYTNKTINEINFIRNYNVAVIVIKRDNELILPESDTLILENDSLIIVGQNDALESFEELLL
jgi:trk system potassium uptake protein TrkA